MDENDLYLQAHKALLSRDYDSARRMFTDLAEKGSAVSWVSLGWMHEHAAGVPKSESDAERCYEKAIALGYSPAHFYLARLMLSLGKHSEAVDHLALGAEDGHVPSKYWLGRCFLLGRGVERDFSEAERYLKDAMSMGHIYARRDYYRWRLRGVFEGRQASDWASWLLAILAGLRLAVRNPQSPLLQ